MALVALVVQAAQAVLTEQVALVEQVEQVVPAVVVLYLEKEALAEKGERLVRTAHLAQMVLQEQMALEPSSMQRRGRKCLALRCLSRHCCAVTDRLRLRCGQPQGWRTPSSALRTKVLPVFNQRRAPARADS